MMILSNKKYTFRLGIIFALFLVLIFGSISNASAYDASIRTLAPQTVASNWARVSVSIAVGDQVNLTWIEYGPNSAMASATGSITLRPNFTFTNYDFEIIGLNPSTTYYYRGVSRNHTTGIITYGNIMTLTTRAVESGSAPLIAPSVGSGTGSSGQSGSSSQRQNNTSGSSFGSTSNNTGLGSVFGFLFGSSNSNNNSSSTGNTSQFVFSNDNSPFARLNQNKFKAGSGDGNSRVAGASSLNLEVLSIENSKNKNDSAYVFSDSESMLEASDLGGELAYSVGYRNNSAYTLSGSSFKIIIPEATELVQLSQEPTRIVGKVIIFEIGDIAPGIQGSVDVKVRVMEDATPGSTLVFTSVLEYRDNSGKLMSVTSYMTALVKGVLKGPLVQTSMLASIFGSYMIVWLVAFSLVILIGVLVVRYKMNSQFNKDQIKIQSPPSSIRPNENKTIGSSAPKDEGFILPGYKIDTQTKK